MATSKKTNKCRNYMYAQQVSYLPNGMNPDDLFSLVDKKLKPKRWAGIVHDHDLKNDNVTPAEDNVHVMMQFENARSLNQIAKEIGDAPQYLEKWDNKAENGFAYLVHATKNARHKHQYSCDEVKANFDYTGFMNNFVKKAAKVDGITSSNKINGLLDLIAAGEMTIKEAKNQLSGSVYAKSSQKLQRAHELYLERKSDSLYREMEENNELVAVHWFYGGSETGKTYLAEKLAKDSGDFYKTTTTKDPFQFYEGENIIILDELRPEAIPYSEMLAMFNPFSRGKVTASSRYFNKPLACRTFFVTTPFDPREFYCAYRFYNSDYGEQLYRRLSSIIMFDENNIYRMEYKEDTGIYQVTDKKVNPYSKKNQVAYTLDNVFDRI